MKKRIPYNRIALLQIYIFPFCGVRLDETCAKWIKMDKYFESVHYNDNNSIIKSTMVTIDNQIQKLCRSNFSFAWFIPFQSDKPLICHLYSFLSFFLFYSISDIYFRAKSRIDLIIVINTYQSISARGEVLNSQTKSFIDR